MSTVRVNLLPDTVRRRESANRRNALIGVGFVGLLALIGAGYWVAVQDVNNAQAEVDEEQATLSALRADLAALQEFSELRNLREQGDRMLQSALGAEASAAGVLQDLATVMPGTAQLNSLAITLSGPNQDASGTRPTTWGTVTMSGETLHGHAPGLERFLLEMDKIAAFSDLYFSNSTVDERGVSTFSASANLGPEVLTGRYADGLPEELR
jgi:Tfp pilus assembly protein PilN